MEGVRYVLLDIEGTICPISFVKDTLFPYALHALPTLLSTDWDSPTFAPYRDAFPPAHRTSPAALQAHVEDLTKRDVKIAYLKNLQGFLWREGYESGAYSTPLFPDVAPTLKRWRGEGVGMAVYSSGSVFAQELLFRHVGVGGELAAGEVGSGETATPKPGVEDLTGLMSGWFDTTNAGLKSEANSYRRIVEALEWPPSQTLFLSDNVKEIDAATSAGLKAILVDRPGNAPVSDADRERMQVVGSFDEIKLT